MEKPGTNRCLCPVYKDYPVCKLWLRLCWRTPGMCLLPALSSLADSVLIEVKCTAFLAFRDTDNSYVWSDPVMENSMLVYFPPAALKGVDEQGLVLDRLKGDDETRVYSMACTSAGPLEFWEDWQKEAKGRDTFGNNRLPNKLRDQVKKAEVPATTLDESRGASA